MTGTVGLKVTLGRWSADGVVPLSHTFDTPGLLARSVSDAAYGFAALDPGLGDPVGFIAKSETLALDGIRIAVDDPFFWDACDPGIAEVARGAIDALASEGAMLRKMMLPEAVGAYAVFLEGGVSAIELRSFLDQELPDWLTQLDPIMASAVHGAETLSAREYLARLARLKVLARNATPRFDEIDVIASPTLCITPPLLSEVGDADAYLSTNRRIVRNTMAVNYLGLCAITLPVGLDAAGMPVGLQLIAPAWAEEKLLAIALAAERALGGATDRLGTPPLLKS
jgi:aspartyl-tRNA(Asn)/glutamyl-tRNA(Gln) amidotransferase subunit A